MASNTHTRLCDVCENFFYNVFREYNHFAVLLECRSPLSRRAQQKNAWVSQANLKFSISNYQLIHIALNLHVFFPTSIVWLVFPRSVCVWFRKKSSLVGKLCVVHMIKMKYLWKKVWNSIRLLLLLLTENRQLKIKTGGLCVRHTTRPDWSKNDIYRSSTHSFSSRHTAVIICRPLIMRGFVSRLDKLQQACRLCRPFFLYIDTK